MVTYLDLIGPYVVSLPLEVFHPVIDVDLGIYTQAMEGPQSRERDGGLRLIPSGWPKARKEQLVGISPERAALAEYHRKVHDAVVVNDSHELRFLESIFASGTVVAKAILVRLQFR